MTAPAHKERKHALLSASRAERWLNCPPSARLEERYKELCGESSSRYADEGTLAHEFADLSLRYAIKQITEKEYNKSLSELRANELYTDEMEEQVEKYTNFVLEEFAAAQAKTKDAVLLIESRLDFSHIVEEGYGTGDAIIIADDVMSVVDFKYGKGVKVEACENPQLKLYGIGALRNYDIIYDIKTVHLIIVQPRIDNYSKWEISIPELYKWGEEVVKPTAQKAYEGKGLHKAGDHCKFCAVKAMCATLAQKSLSVTKHNFKEPELLSDEQLVGIYKQTPMLLDWLNSVSEYLLNKSLDGQEFPGLKLVEGRSRRKWVDEDKVRAKLKEEGYPEDSYIKTSLRGISDIERLVGKKEFPILMKDLFITPQGNPTLVLDTDARPEYKRVEQAKKDFSDN